MNLEIRSAKKGEAGLILAFIREIAAFEQLSHEVDATDALIDEALFGPQPRVFCDIAEWNRVPAGFAMWYLNFSSFRGRNGVYLEDVFVRPEFRGKGIGQAFLKRLARRCVTEGWTRLEWSVLDWNKEALGFYKAHGATIMHEWRICRVSGKALCELAS